VRSANSGSSEDDGADFAQYFPTFLWLVRDFTLQLVNSDGQAFSSKEYLERALQAEILKIQCIRLSIV
jgi:hypothetical protein